MLDAVPIRSLCALAPDAILCMCAGRELLASPGPGGYKIEWSPGTKLMSLESTPSKHLVIPCDNFDEIKQTSGGEQLALITDHINGEGTWQ